MVSTIEQISEDLNVPPQLVENALRHAHVFYRKIRVPKRNGGYRTFIQPATELKMIHEWLTIRVLSALPLSSVATGFFPGASILKNANVHRTSRYSVRVDLENFFPSVQGDDLIQVIITSRSQLPALVANADFTDLIKKACFDNVGRLPVGYPTSPLIANAVMFSIDNELLDIVNSNSEMFGRSHLTRYADDFVFSTDKTGACRDFVATFRDLINRTASPNLRMNENKTRYMSRQGGSTLVTGLRINQDGIVRVHADYRDHVRLLLKHFARGTLNSAEQRKLIGHLAFIEHADPRLFTRLSYRYYVEIDRLRGKCTET